jgi:hypothetical protein
MKFISFNQVNVRMSAASTSSLIGSNIFPLNKSNLVSEKCSIFQKSSICLNSQQNAHAKMLSAESNDFTKTNKNELSYQNAFVNELDQQFKINDLVWAKLDNFPWWPCQIITDSNNQFFKIIGIY